MAYPSQIDAQPKVPPSSLLAPADFACLDVSAHATSTGQNVSHHPPQRTPGRFLRGWTRPHKSHPTPQDGTPGRVYRSFHFTQCCVQKGDPL